MRALLCVLLAAAVSFAQGGRKKPTFDVPESERAAPAGPTAEAERDAMRRTVSRLAGWPHERARRAAERLIVQKEKSRNTVLAVLLSTEREHRALKPGAAYVLGRIGEPAHFMTLLHVAIEKQQQKHAAVFLEAAWRLDQPRAVAESFRFFHLSTTTLRREATRFVLDRVKRDNLPAILDLLDRRKAERPFTREIGLRLLDRLVQTREVEWKDVQHYFYRSLGDDSPGVASRSMRMLASLNNKENIGELNQRIAGEKMPWRKRSYAALSLSILSSAFKVQPYSEEAIAVLKGRKGMGHPREILARSSSALALTQVALRTNREEYVRMLDRAIPERLIEAVGGTRRHYRDFGTVMPLAFATLRRITGQTLPDEAPAWARWWQDHNRSFRAKRELNGIAEQDLSSMVVEIARPAASGGTRMRLQVVGGAKPVFRHGRAFALAKADMSALLDELSAAKFFTRAEERSEEPARDAAVFVVRVGDLDRSVAYGSGSEGDLALRERLLMRVQTLADRYVWQHFWDADTQPSWNLFFLENHRWFKTHADAEEHAIRLRGMITGSLDDMIDPGARLFATRFLAGLSGGGAALDERQVTSMVQAVAAEPAANEFVGEVVDLLVPAAGSDAAVGLVGALATKVGPSAQAMLEHLCASTTQQQVAKLSSDKRWKVRRAAVRALAKRDTKLSRPLLRARLEDDEALVRVAAAEALARQKDRSILPRLQKMAKSESARVREVTAYSLALLGSRESLGSLRALLFEDSVPSVRAHAVEGLVESRHPDAPELLIDVFRQESDVGVRSAAATGIVKLESPDLVNELMDRLQLTTALDPERVALVNVLARFRSEAPMDLLRQVLQGDDQPSADAAALGLARQWEDASLTQLVRMAKRGGPTTRVAVRHLQLLTSQEFKTESYRRQAESYSAWATSALSENPRKWYMDALTT
ncbi:MAG: HEAT repeat domain-containing protein, partial [Planctomycetota bacterium]|nr:HEAT repeat domain-containing protein [Planctomycetota bacterium]